MHGVRLSWDLKHNVERKFHIQNLRLFLGGNDSKHIKIKTSHTTKRSHRQKVFAVTKHLIASSLCIINENY